ncbi:MAG: acetyl-CoA C-acetyltransferase [Myxococcales bacterium]|jgi:acetyl-CoA C-acetyltransferase|nr:acetyl-CoA C-acetyltransferase [Myxococcales bacterium]
MSPRDVVIVGAARTPLGAFQGSLAPLPATRLGATAIRAALERGGVRPESVELTIMGCVLQAGLGQAPARQAALGAGLGDSTPAVTLNKVCGSGIEAVIAAARAIQLGELDVAVAGGMESMTNAPYLDTSTRQGARMGNVTLIDAMIHDGLWDPYSNQHMGLCAEKCACEQGFTREAQDAFAKASGERAQAAQRAGKFDAEIVPIEVPQRRGEPIIVREDDGLKAARPDKLPLLRPAFKKDGTITAGNASSISDGAAALVLMSRERAAREGRSILATIRSHAAHAQPPIDFTLAPIGAMHKALDRAGLSIADIDLFEINEAFAVVTMAAMKALEIPAEKVNVKGGATVLGHPIGASGARLLVTLLYALIESNARRGLASLCIGGGEGIAVVIER